MELNGMAILTDSLVVDGIDRKDYHDFCDAYFDFARFADGTVLTDDQLEELTDKYRDVLHEKVFDHIF
jgi:phosphosulfolactate synthase (CoM biosynthesis protein A)